MTMRKGLLAVAVATVLFAACGQPTQQGQGSQGDQAASCQPGDLSLLQSGQLTVGTDNPAYSPWYAGGTSKDSPWKINDPNTGKGFESAVAYAVAGELGFSEDEVEWVEVPFTQIFKPGPKDFDFAINQVSYKPARDEAVDFSDSYYDVNQALVAVKGTPIASATSLEDLRQYRLGAPVGTTSFDYIEQNIQPEQDPGVYDTQNDAITALNNGQIDGIVVDAPTAFYIADPFVQQVENSVVVGQFPSVGEQEYFGLVLETGNPLLECVNRALAALKADGTLQEIQQTWLSEKTNVGEAPVLQ
jgi:polar amino acid transport system substrate-binding protein